MNKQLEFLKQIVINCPNRKISVATDCSGIEVQLLL